jgi:hypothetical protein
VGQGTFNSNNEDSFAVEPQFKASLNSNGVTTYGLEDRKVRADKFILISPYLPDWFCGPPNRLSTGYLGEKQQGREADHSTPTRAEFKKTWIYTPTPPYVFIAYCSVKYRDKLTFFSLSAMDLNGKP